LAPLEICAELYGGEVCMSLTGSLRIVPKIGRVILHRRVDAGRKTPLIAICMATYNPSIGFFKEQIDSIIRQTCEDWICIINDDCSRPELFAKIKEIAEADNRFIVYRNSSNLGFYHNFEKCLSYIPDHISYVALADQDDYWHENKLSDLSTTLEIDKKTLLVYSDMNIVNEHGEVIHPTYWTTRRNNFTELDLLIIANTVTGASSLFRRDLLELLLPFPEKIGDSYHDNFIACTALSLGSIQYVPYPLYDYRQHTGNIFGHKAHDTMSNNLRGIIKIITTAGTVRNVPKAVKQILLNYQAVYYSDYIRKVHLAYMIDLRCKNMSEKKRKIIRRFISLEKGMDGIIFEIVKNRLFRKGSITLNNDSQLLLSLLSARTLKIYYRVKQYFLQ